jgi:hypothetical protein
VKGEASSEPIPIEIPTYVEASQSIEFVGLAKPRDKLFEREEIGRRVAGFKATQMKFQRDREAYFAATMAKDR